MVITIIRVKTYTIVIIMKLEQPLLSDDGTTVQIKKKTKEKLDKLIISKRETYDDIISRLIKEHEERNKK